ncbi:hypothetical protein [uncultured Bacteroides sp.]|uniref:hypothetical protein n=1 Tax=uncultured Bacteroides sp. TaxID=162156 RepID=UPI002AAAFB11|nr:hypothetical protein [uncultured Bacteroides sp.]
MNKKSIKTRYLFLLLSFIFPIICLSQKNENCKIEKIIVKHVGFYNHYTTVDVPCHDFEKAFNHCTDFKVHEIKDSLAIKNFLKLLCNLELRDSTIYPNIDTRAKIELCSQKDTLVVCLNQFLTIKDGVKYKTSEALRDFIENMK